MPELTMSSVIAGALLVVVLSVFLPIAFDLVAYGCVFAAGWYFGRNKRGSST